MCQQAFFGSQIGVGIQVIAIVHKTSGIVLFFLVPFHFFPDSIPVFHRKNPIDMIL